MAYTPVPTVVDGDDLVDDWGNAVSAAATELQTLYPELVSTWTPGVSGFSKGNGTELARFARRGPHVKCLYEFTLGSTSSVSGDITIDLPTGHDAAYRFLGNGWFFDASGPTQYLGLVVLGSATTARLKVINATSTNALVVNASSTNPFTWATGDIFVMQFEYVRVA